MAAHASLTTPFCATAVASYSLMKASGSGSDTRLGCLAIHGPEHESMSCFALLSENQPDTECCYSLELMQERAQ